MKVCKKCGSKDRHPSGTCRPCATERNREYRKLNTEKEKANRDRWRRENREKLNAQNRAWIEKAEGRVVIARGPRTLKRIKDVKAPRVAKEKPTHKERAVKAEWHCKKCGSKSKNKSGNCRDCTNERNHIARTVHAARSKEIRDAYRAKKADVLNAQGQKRRALAKGRGVLSNNIAETLYRQQNGLCNCCGKQLGSEYDMDHIMPLSLGGANEDWNMQLLTSSCNRSKGAKNPIAFLISKALNFA